MEQNVQKAEQMKYRLADAMKNCMKKMPVEKITVKEISPSRIDLYIEINISVSLICP